MSSALKISLLSVAVYWMYAPGLFAQSHDIRFERFTIEDGLSQSTVFSVCRDRFGFMWFGTWDGLNRFDGYEFKQFHNEPKDPWSLSNNDVAVVIEDRAGRLWAGSKRGLNLYNHEQRRFEIFLSDPAKPDSLSHDSIWTLLEGPDGIWIGTENGLNHMKEKGVFQTWFHDPNDPGSISDNLIVSLMLDHKNELWVGTHNGLNHFDSATQTFESYLVNTERHSHIHAIAEDEQGVIWLATDRGGLVRMSADRGDFTIYQQVPNQPNSLPNNEVRALLVDSQNRLWVGTDDGLARYRPESDDFQRYIHSANDPGSITSDRIRTIYEDGRGVFWAGTAVGLNSFSPDDRGFRTIKQNIEDQRSLSHGIVWAIQRDRSGTLWVGTEEGLNRFDKSGNRIGNFLPDGRQGSISHESIWSIYEDQDGTLWFGAENGLLRFTEPDSFEAFNHSGLVREYDWIKEIEGAASGDLWLGTSEGLSYFDVKQKEFSRVELIDQTVAQPGIRALLMEQDGLWAGSEGEGLFFRDHAGEIINYRHVLGDGTSISHNAIKSLIRDSRNRLWVGTDGGLNLYSEEHGFQVFNMSTGLPNNVIYGILEDDQGFLWLSTNRGLVRFDPESKAVKTYTKRDGIQSNEFNQGSYYRDTSGNLFFGGVAGLTWMNPKRVTDDSYAPAPVFTEFLLFNKEIAYHEAMPLEKPIYMSEKITLSHRDNLISFNIMLPNYRHTQANRFHYKLENLYSDWVDLGAQNTMTFTNLDAGTYTLKVRGSNSDGVWSEDTADLTLLVKPAPWNTWWARMIYISLGLLLIRNFLNRQRAELKREREVSTRLRQIDHMKDEFLANTSHELRTPLNGIIGLAESLRDGAAGPVNNEVSRNLNMLVSSGKRLSNLVNDILDFAKLKDQELHINQQSIDLYASVDVVLTLAKPLAGDKPVTLHNQTPNDLYVQADENRLQQILYNLVGNAIKFTDKGSVTCSAEIIDEMIQISIIDTGVGIQDEHLSRIFDSFEQADDADERPHEGTGLGLAITKKLVELHGGTIRVESVYGEGSQFIFSLPPALEPQPVSPKKASKSAGDLIKPKSTPLNDPPSQPTPTLPGNAFRILVVDDEPVNRQVIVNHFSGKHMIEQASSGPDALRLFREGATYDLVLLDVMMPRMSGFEVCRKLREKYRSNQLPIIFLTAKDRLADLAHAFEIGANDYLTKPISKVELMSRVSLHLQLLDTHRNLESKVRKRTKALAERNDEMERFEKIIRAINQELHLEPLMKSLLEEGLKLFPAAEGGAYMVRKPDSKFYRLTMVEFNGQKSPEIELSEGEIQERYLKPAFQIGEGAWLNRNLPRASIAEKIGLNWPAPRSLLILDITSSERLPGYLFFANFENQGAFNNSDVARLNRYRDHAVSALVKADYLMTLEEKNQEILRTRDHMIMQEKMASLGKFAAGMAHEIRNPLNFVNNFAAVVQDMTSELPSSRNDQEQFENLSTEIRNSAEKIQNYGQRADQIIAAVIDQAKGEIGDPKMVHLNSFLEDQAMIAINNRNLKQGIKIPLSCDLDERITHFKVIETEMNRALIALIGNAVDAVMERNDQAGEFSPMIELKTRLLGNQSICIHIRDNGVGIDPGIMPKVFDPFFTTKEPDSGHVGLGLTLCYEIIVNGHGGRLNISSEPGSTDVCIELPASGQRKA